ncbi:MAG: E6 protein [Varecia variegata papillomavirus 1]|nr:MAG: E6 protein [Varecia variegata papillomavirus 1]
MAVPRTIAELCGSLGVPRKDILLACIFCREFLQFGDLCAFDYKNLSLVWRGQTVFGACGRCIRLRAVCEIVQQSALCLEADGVEAITHKKLKDILVRCRVCFKLLDYPEKLQCAGRRIPFILVRRWWRAFCRCCLPK